MVVPTGIELDLIKNDGGGEDYDVIDISKLKKVQG